MDTNVEVEPASMPRLIRIDAVCKRIGLGKASVYKLMKQSDFPKQVHVGPRASAWIESEVQGWIKARIAERDVQ